jgi:small subunit ribosomal protein S16
VSVKIRLRRQGAKKQPSYRIVVADSRAPRDGRFIEIIGHYNPRRTPTELHIDHEKAQQWLKNGAQPTEIVNTLFRSEGLPARPSRSSLLVARRKAEAEVAARKQQRAAARSGHRKSAPAAEAPAPIMVEPAETAAPEDEGGAEA